MTDQRFLSIAAVGLLVAAVILPIPIALPGLSTPATGHTLAAAVTGLGLAVGASVAAHFARSDALGRWVADHSGGPTLFLTLAVVGTALATTVARERQEDDLRFSRNALKHAVRPGD